MQRTGNGLLKPKLTNTGSFLSLSFSIHLPVMDAVHAQRHTLDATPARPANARARLSNLAIFSAAVTNYT